MIVVDASVIANVIGDDGPDGTIARAAIRNDDAVAPDLLDVEVLAVLRKRWLRGDITDERLALAVDDLIDLPIDRQPMIGLVRRAYDLRSNVTPYDAVYVALAELLGCALVTADRRLAHAPTLRAEIRVVSRTSPTK